MEQADTITKIEVNTKLVEPSQYNVIYINDDVTTFDFVMLSLMEIFGYSPDDAESITISVHENGQAVVGTFSYEVAEQKAAEVILMAQLAGFSLQTIVKEAI